MKWLVFFLVIFTISSGFLYDMSKLGLSDEVIKYIADMSRKIPPVQENGVNGKSNKDDVVVTKCVDQNWNQCQAISAVLSTNQTGVVSVCNDNTKFYQCLGTSYYDCMDLYRMLQLPGADFDQAFNYVATYLQVHFMCNAGFEEVMKDYYCIISVSGTQAVQSCTANITDPSQMCSQVDQADACLNAAYQAGCNTAEIGWWGCEEFRVAFDSSCYGLRCTVNH